jgi:hypothetical protein
MSEAILFFFNKDIFELLAKSVFFELFKFFILGLIFFFSLFEEFDEFLLIIIF